VPAQNGASVNTHLIPPRDMLYDGSTSLEEFVTYGENFCQYILVPRAQLVPDAAILDVGCGNGAVARALTHVLSPGGRYEGLDIKAANVSWLQEQYKAYSNFGFTHADLRSSEYNASGRIDPSDYRFPYPDRSFDIVLAKSVFTHMLPAEVRNYLGEISRVLRQYGRSVSTFFLLNDESRNHNQSATARIQLRHAYRRDPLCRVFDTKVPAAAVGHDELRVRCWYAEVGLSTVEIAFGNWCGRQSSLGLQDVVIALKA
jgi:ubiquinone/menaquinone biosynthesis C-methylase UbiE